MKKIRKFIPALFGLFFHFPLMAAPMLTSKVDDKMLRFDRPDEVYEDPFHDLNGPYYHQIFQAESSDGYDFQKQEGMLFDKASVPDAVAVNSKQIFLYAVDGSGRSRSHMMAAVSDDGGFNWRQGSLQVKGADPQIVRLPEGGEFRLFFVVHSDKENQILSALSSDGIHFKKEEGVRFTYPNITDPDVVLIKKTWWMYVSQGPKLLAASSIDGLKFEYVTTVRDQGSVSKTVFLGGNRWRQFFCDRGIRSAVSSNGREWYEEEGYRLEPEDGFLICDPTTVQVGSKWIMYYKRAPLPH